MLTGGKHTIEFRGQRRGKQDVKCPLIPEAVGFYADLQLVRVYKLN